MRVVISDEQTKGKYFFDPFWTEYFKICDKTYDALAPGSDTYEGERNMY